MPAYVISDVQMRDPARFEQYRALAADSIARYGGRYVVRGGAIDVVEGDWTPSALVIVEFPSMARAREWYASAEYAKALAVRQSALTRNLVFVEGP